MERYMSGKVIVPFCNMVEVIPTRDKNCTHTRFSLRY